MSRPAQCNTTSIRSLLCSAWRDGGRNLVRVGQVDLVPVSLPAGALDRVDRVERRAGPLDAGQLALDELRRGPFAVLPDAIGELALEPVAVAGEPRQIRIGRIRCGTRSSRWKVPPEAGARSAMIVWTMLPAAPVTMNAVSPPGSRCGFVDGRLLDQADRPPQLVGVADLHGAGIAQRLVEQRLSHGRSVDARAEVHGLDQRVRALLRHRLGEARDGASEHARGPIGVVPVTAAESGPAHQERALVRRALASSPRAA